MHKGTQKRGDVFERQVPRNQPRPSAERQVRAPVPAGGVPRGSHRLGSRRRCLAWGSLSQVRRRCRPSSTGVTERDHLTRQFLLGEEDRGRDKDDS